MARKIFFCTEHVLKALQVEGLYYFCLLLNVIALEKWNALYYFEPVDERFFTVNRQGGSKKSAHTFIYYAYIAYNHGIDQRCMWRIGNLGSPHVASGDSIGQRWYRHLPQLCYIYRVHLYL